VKQKHPKAKGKVIPVMERHRTKAERDQLSNVAIYEEIKYLQSLVVIRKRKGLSVADVATRMGMSEQFVLMLETPGYDPTLSVLRRYMAAIETVSKTTVRPLDPEPEVQPYQKPSTDFPIAG
jgi:ribosome-binding protein aMBF1 (putative translation factor)